MPLDNPASRAARYREIARSLWRISCDQSKDIHFEARRRLATVADELEDLANVVGGRTLGRAVVSQDDEGAVRALPDHHKA